MGVGHTKLDFFQKPCFTLKQDGILKKNVGWWNHVKYGYTGILQIKLQNLTRIFGSRMGRELMTALVQVFMDHCITTGTSFLWASSPRNYEPRCWLSWVVQNSSWLRTQRWGEYTSASYSRASLAALAKTVAKSSLIWECMQALGKLSESSKVTLMWTAVIPFSEGKSFISIHLKTEHQARQDAFTGCRQSKTLLPARANELLAVSKRKLTVAAGLLEGHTTVQTRQECGPWGHDKEDRVELCVTVQYQHAKIQDLQYTFLRPKDLLKVRLGNLLGLVANTRLGLFPQTHKPSRSYSGTIMI